MGVAPKDFDIKKFVGDDRNSWALASNGKQIHDGVGETYTQELISGDVITVILSRRKGRLRF